MSSGLIDAIENLQQYDAAVVDAAKKRAGCDARLKELAASRRARAEGIASAAAGREEARKRQRALEKDLAAKSTEIAKFEGRYNMLTSQKEIEKYESELSRLQGEKGALEEGILLAMEEAETLDATHAALGREDRERSMLDSIDEEKTRDEAERLDGERTRLLKLRAEFAASLPPEAVAEYEALRAKKSPAVARVERDTCQGCHLSISVNVLSDLRDRQRLRKCTNCGRILFLPPR